MVSEPQTRRMWRGIMPLLVLSLGAFGCGGDQTPESGQPDMPGAETAGEQAAPATGFGSLAEADLPEGVTFAMINEGKGVFEGAGICYTCHGQDGAGTQIGPSFNDDQWLHIDGSYPSIVQQIMTGVQQPMQYPGVMPPRGGSNISDEDVGRVAAYVWALSHGGS